VRYDFTDINADDFMNSATFNNRYRQFRTLNAMLGLSYQVLAATHIYSNVSSGSETPTLIELTNNPQGMSGLHPTLKAQRLLNFEAGAKGGLLTRYHYDVAFFLIDVTDELVPYELPDEPGRTFYRNAGRSRHQGIESSLHGPLFYAASFSLAYTYSDFYFLRFPVGQTFYDGHMIPGIPNHNFFSEIFYGHPSGLYSRIEIQGVSHIYADDTNSERQKAYWLVKIQAGLKRRFGNWSLEPSIGLNNLFNTIYADNIRINAFGKRFYEPAPPFNLFIALSAGYEFPVL
jgi:iron complex outermembrane receptor protein